MKAFIFIFQIFLLIKVNCQECRTNNAINNNNCFNEVLFFDLENKYYRAGHFATNKNGDMVIEYSFDNYRLFYGLKKDGKKFFPETIKEIEITPRNISASLARYESVNKFVSLENDTNKEKEYLLSISSYKTILELHDLEKDEYNIESAVSFFGKEEGIYAYVFQVLEKQINNKTIYFCIYTFKLQEYYIPNGFGIKRFGFRNFDFNSIVDYGEFPFNFNRGTRITSSIIIDYYNVLAIFFIHSDYDYYYVSFYSFELNELRSKEVYPISSSSYSHADGIFFKSIYIYYQYIAFLFFVDNYQYHLNIYYVTGNFELDGRLEYSDSHMFLSDIALNDFIKIDDDRLVFISTETPEQPKLLYLIFFDLYDWCQYVGIRYYTIDFNSKIYKFTKELASSLYNGYLAFTATLLPLVPNDTLDNFFSIFLIFGYANGTDATIDIYPYLSDTDSYDSSNNLYNFLSTTMKIDNNIIGYENSGQIKLISLPEEIEFHSGLDNSLLSNGDSINTDSILKQNKNIIKSNNSYYLEYQFVIQEPQFNEFYYKYPYQVNFPTQTNLSSYYNPKKLYGRTNTLKFKLCHSYCKTCSEFGSSDIDQKCESCLEQYSYNSLSQSNSLCIPEGYFYNSESGALEQCTSDNSKFYIDINSNKTICFKNADDCPDDYSFYNEETKECKYSKNFQTTIIEITESPKNTEVTQTENNYNPKTSSIKETTSKLETNTETETQKIVPKTTMETEIQKNEKNNKGNCSLEDLVENSCSNLNYTNGDIKEKIDNELLLNFNISSNQNIEIKGENNTVFQLTTTDYELNRFNGYMLNNNGLSVIDLGNCETLLKIHYKINNDSSLIIKKYEQLTISAERNVQYEVYHPITKEKLNLSVCDSETIDLYIPVQLNEQLLELYEDLKSNGYDLFNIQDPFYNDLCSPYKSENGTDVLLSDRKNDYYNNNYTTCQQNCEYSSFNSEYKFLKCECKVIVDDIDINNFDKFSKKIYKNFYDILKNSNYKTLKCYNLVFNFNYLKKNLGNFVVLIFFAGYLSFLFIYTLKGITPLQGEAIKTVCNKFKDVNKNKLEKSLTEKKLIDNKNKKQNIIDFPPKKRKTVVAESNLNLEGADKKDKKHKKKRKSKTLKKSETINNRRKSVKDKRISIAEEKNEVYNETKKDIFENNEKNKIKKKRKSKDKIVYDNTNKNINKLDDLDLNNLNYEKALELDKRTITQIYWSKLKSKHLIIYTFVSCNDYNLIYIKISRFLFLICTSMAMNVIFFFDSSMHKIYLDYGKYNFIQQIPQIIYSSIVSLIIEILIGILSYTDKNIYEIRQMEEFNTDKLKQILKSIRIKLIIYFVITFLFFAFYWYLISSFCAVYTNTQIIYLKDFATSFCLGLVYPFLIQLCFAFLRIFSLKQNTKGRSILYKVECPSSVLC